MILYDIFGIKFINKKQTTICPLLQTTQIENPG